MVPESRSEAGKILKLPELVTQAGAEILLDVGKGNLRKVSGLPEPVYVKPCKQWRRSDVEMLARARAARSTS